MLRYTTDRTRPGLVALYNIRPRNGAGQFLQPRSPHRAKISRVVLCNPANKQTNADESITSLAEIILPRLQLTISLAVSTGCIIQQ